MSSIRVGHDQEIETDGPTRGSRPHRPVPLYCVSRRLHHSQPTRSVLTIADAAPIRVASSTVRAWGASADGGVACGLLRDVAWARDPFVLAVVNQKGGVGKTTTAVNLAACLAASERPTLLIDMDPQANASSAYGIAQAERQVYDALVDGLPLTHCAVETELETLHVVPAGRDLVGAEIELVDDGISRVPPRPARSRPWATRTRSS
jgi:Mrp family chromosome partitioning ATPase